MYSKNISHTQVALIPYSLKHSPNKKHEAQRLSPLLSHASLITNETLHNNLIDHCFHALSMPKTLPTNPNHDQDLELLKAVAQAWHAQTGHPKPTNKEFAAHNNRRRNFNPRPTRFKLEATKQLKNSPPSSSSSSSLSWDFSESLLDSYELVTLAKTLEANMALDHPLTLTPPNKTSTGAESRNSLRNLFYSC